MALAEGGGGFAVVRARLPSAQRYYIEQAAICQRQTWPGTDVRGPQCFQLVKPHPSTDGCPFTDGCQQESLSLGGGKHWQSLASTAYHTV